MSRRFKYLLYVLVALFGCVGLGQWMQYRYVVAAALRSRAEYAYRKLDAAGKALIPKLNDQLETHRADRSELFRQWEETLRQGADAQWFAITIVDRTGRAVVSVGDARADRESIVSAGHLMEWKAQPSDVPGVNTGTIVTLASSGDAQQCLLFELGHSDYQMLLHRPSPKSSALGPVVSEMLPTVSAMTFFWTCALQGITVYMILSRFHEEVDRKTAEVEALSLRRIDTLVRTRDAVIFGLAKLAESRDPETGSHLDRISVYSSAFASALRSHPKYAAEVAPTFVRLIEISSVLHDIGKVGIEDEVLRKPGLLTDQERKRMQVHTTIGGQCLLEIEHRLGSSNFLEMAREIAFAHHERWDGTGYPNGLKGEETPLAARIVAIVDVYDALSTKRVYKEAYGHEKCVEMIRDGAGTHFDPELVQVWLTVADRFRDIAQQYADKEAEADAQVEAEPLATGIMATSSAALLL